MFVPNRVAVLIRVFVEVLVAAGDLKCRCELAQRRCDLGVRVCGDVLLASQPTAVPRVLQGIFRPIGSAPIKGAGSAGTARKRSFQFGARGPKSLRFAAREFLTFFGETAAARPFFESGDCRHRSPISPEPRPVEDRVRSLRLSRWQPSFLGLPLRPPKAFVPGVREARTLGVNSGITDRA